MPKIELNIGALPAHARTARLVAAALGRRIGLEAVIIDEVKLAVGEACSRAVSVHRAAHVTDPIVIRFIDDDEMLEVSVRDFGPPGAQLKDSIQPPHGFGSPAPVDLPVDLADAEAADLLEAAAYSAAEPPDLQRSVDMASLEPRLGLAVIAGLVDDVSVEGRSDPAGTLVTMRWPIIAV